MDEMTFRLARAVVVFALLLSALRFGEAIGAGLKHWKDKRNG